MRKAYVVGLGMTKFSKPSSENPDYTDLARESVIKALVDCQLTFTDIQQAFVAYVYGDSACGQAVLYQMGMTGIPIFNVHNNCASGGTVLYLAKDAIECGKSDCVLALGFEKMFSKFSIYSYKDRASPYDNHFRLLKELNGLQKGPLLNAQMFNAAGVEYMNKYGATIEHFAKIAYKNHKHSVHNPNAQLQVEYSLDNILNSKLISGFLTMLQCCPTSDGGAAVVIASEKFVKKHKLESQAVEIVGMELATDLPSTFSNRSCISLVGYDLTKFAADKLFDKAKCNPAEVQVVELHDCFSVNELLCYESLGLCEPGRGAELIDRGDNTYGGKYVVNPSGGLISKGHPLGATGIAQCIELCLQLRGEAGKRQVEKVKLALQHNYGGGGAVVVALYALGFPKLSKKSSKKKCQKFKVDIPSKL